MLDKKPIEYARLEGHLRELYVKDPKRRTMIKADGAVPYKHVRETFLTLQKVGFHGVALRVSKRSEGAK